MPQWHVKPAAEVRLLGRVAGSPQLHQGPVEQLLPCTWAATVGHPGLLSGCLKVAVASEAAAGGFKVCQQRSCSYSASLPQSSVF